MSAKILSQFKQDRAALLENQNAFEVAGGSRYAERYGRYGGDVGANRGGGGGDCDTPWTSSSTGAGHGRRIGTTKNGCEPLPPRCDCHVIGANTINSPGVLSGQTGTLTIDSGDASYFVPYYIAVVAYQVLSSDTGLLANPGTPLMALLINSTSGREPNMRRASATDPTFGVWTQVYGFEKELECVDWKKFASTNNQQLTMNFYNPNTADIHIFVNIWGLAAA